MRIRATVAAVTGALALSALAVPAAQAADPASGADIATPWGITFAEGGPSSYGAASASAAAAAVADPDVSFSAMKINRGKPIVVANKHKTVSVTYTLTHPADFDITAENFLNGPFLYLGTAPDSVTDVDTTPVLFGDDPATCTVKSSTTASCKAVIDIRPGAGDLRNSYARTWKAGGLALLVDEVNGELGETWQGNRGKVAIKRHSKLTANAAPEPVKKGRTITVTGKLSHAGWGSGKYVGYKNRSVQLQFKKKGTSTFKKVKTIKTRKGGALRTTVRAKADGTYRYVFAGNSATAAVKSKGDFIDVK
ncbi:hypothetical protein [Streptomyces sp. NPDC002845]